MKYLITVAGFSMMALMAGCGGGGGSTSSQSPAALPPVVAPPQNAIAATLAAERNLVTAILNGDAAAQNALVSNNYHDTSDATKTTFIANNLAVVKQLVADGFTRWAFEAVPTGATLSADGRGAVIIGAYALRIYLANGHSVTISAGAGDAWRYESDGVWRLVDSETLTQTFVTIQSAVRHN